jgi:pyruvate/2-oxoglutarate dehydrogenase complex dihydrolipoamide acyltransferase (E2) component
MTLVTVTLPKLAETTDVLVVDEWLIAVGDTIAVDQEVASVETDKVTVTFPSPVAGVVKELLVAEGDEVNTGDPVCTVDT